MAANFDSLPDSFCAGARYSERMDCAIYLKEDCSYRSMRISQKLSLLVDPYDDEKPVGVKIKGVQHLIERLISILDDKIDDKVELKKLLQVAILSDEYAESAMSEAELERRKQLSDRAHAFLSEENVSLAIPLALAA